MPKVTLNRAAVLAGERYDAGDTVDYSGDDVQYLISVGICSLAPEVAPTASPKRTKAQIEADLAAARKAEAALQSDLSQATD